MSVKERATRGISRRASRAVGCALGAAWAVVAASTPEAWSAYDQEVVKACVGASSLRDARAAGTRVDFDDSVGYSALLIIGRYPQPHMQNQPGRELCLFDKRTRTAVVADADSLIIRKAAPAAPSGH
jgi:hypothetical protein